MVAQADGMDRIYHCAVGATIAVGTSAGHHAFADRSVLSS